MAPADPVVLLAAMLVPTFESRWSLSLAVIAVCCLVAYVFARFTERRTRARPRSGRCPRRDSNPDL
jgi:hypothetical protein